jgi:hypothetical protein
MSSHFTKDFFISEYAGPARCCFIQVPDHRSPYQRERLTQVRRIYSVPRELAGVTIITLIDPIKHVCE